MFTLRSNLTFLRGTLGSAALIITLGLIGCGDNTSHRSPPPPPGPYGNPVGPGGFRGGAGGGQTVITGGGGGGWSGGTPSQDRGGYARCSVVNADAAIEECQVEVRGPRDRRSLKEALNQAAGRDGELNPQVLRDPRFREQLGLPRDKARCVAHILCDNGDDEPRGRGGYGRRPERADRPAPAPEEDPGNDPDDGDWGDPLPSRQRREKADLPSDRVIDIQPQKPPVRTKG